MTTTRYALLAASILLVAVGVAGIIFWPRIAHLLSPTIPGDPDEVESGDRPDPVEHEGASEEWGSKLRALRKAPVAPELISDTERDLNWALAWHEFERGMQDEIDRVFAPYLAALPAEDFEELRELTCPRELVA